MADLQITGLSALAEAGIQPSDVLALADLSASETKKVTVKDLVNAVVTDSGTSFLGAGSIPGSKIGTLGTNAVVTASITDLNVTAAKIANNTITATQIAADAIGTSELADNAVDTGALAANSVTTAKITDLNITTDKLASNAVTTVKITDSSVTFAKLNLSDGDIPGAKLTSASVTATQIATNAVTATELADNAVDTAAIASGAVTGAKIASTTIAAGNIVNNTITATQIANGAIGTTQIADGAVTAAKLSGTLAASSIADDAVTTAKIVDDAVTSAKLAANAVDAAALADNAVDSGAIASNAVIEAKIAANAVTVTKIADGTITPAKLNTSNLDRSLNVASGNLGINNTITAATRSGITYNAQGLITGTVALAAADLPVATSSAVGGVSVGTGLSVSGAGALSLTNSVTGATVSGITFNNQGMITAATALVAGDLPVATTSAKGAVQITSGGGLTVDGSGNLTTSTSGVSAGTYQSVTVNNKGVITAGAGLTESLIPSLSAAKITSGTIDAARIGTDSIDGTKLTNSSTALFQSVQQTGAYPTAQYNGQLLFDTVSEDCFIWDGNAWQAITTLTKGSLVFGGTFNATTSKMVSTTTSGIAAGLAVGSNLPTPSATTDGVYVVVSTSGTPSAPAPVVALAPPDYILGVTNTAGSSWNEVDLSQTVAGQVASNITFTPFGQLSSTNVQDAIQEVESEKLSKAGGTVTGEVLIGVNGSLVFEGTGSDDEFETRLTVANPTTSDKVITLPNITGTVITHNDTGTVTGTMLANDTIQNVDIKSDAAIAYSKLASVASGYLLVGNGASTSVAAAVAVTGDISINNAGLTSIASNVIVDADIKSDAAISGSKIVQGTTSVLGVLQLTDAVDSASTTTAATPAAVKLAKDAADAAQTTADAALPKDGSSLMTGHLQVDNDKEVRFFEADSNGSNYVGIKGATDKGDNGSYTLSLPAASPNTGQVLKAGSTATTLEWAADSATDNTKMPLAGGTFTGDVTFTGDASNGLWDKSASAFVANLTGNVTGTASIATSITVADESSDTTCFPLFATAATGDLGAKSGSNLTFNSNTGALTATSFVGALTGNVTGNVSGSAATVTGAAQSAITSLGTLTGLTVGGDVSLTGGSKFLAGSSAELEIYHSTYSRIVADDLRVVDKANGHGMITAVAGGAVGLRYANNQKLATTNTGATVTGTLVADGLTVDTNTLHVDATNNRVGIGTTSPIEAIQATGAIVSTGSNNTSSTAGANRSIIDFTSGGTRIGHFRGTTSAGSGSVKFFVDSSEKMQLDSSGRLLLGHTANINNGAVQIVSDGSAVDCLRFAASEYGSHLNLIKSRSGTVGTNTIVNNNDDVGTLSFRAADGSNYIQAASIQAEVDGTPGTADMPGRLVFSTTADGANSATERMRINSAGQIVQGTTTPRERVHFHYDSSDENYLRFTNSTTGSAAGDGFNIGLNSAEQALIWNKENTSMLFGTNGSTALTLDTSQNATFAGTVSDSKGDLRKIIKVDKTSAYVIVASDSGKAISITTGGVTVNASVMSGSEAVTIINHSGSDQTITQGSGMTMYNTADANSGNRVLAGRGMATIYYVGGDTSYISGAGLS